MITVITGLTGSGKTWLMSRLALKRRKKFGETIYPNLSFNFPNDNESVIRWHGEKNIFVFNL
jgi:ABC-type lipoprotein export system ATPase subunit